MKCSKCGKERPDTTYVAANRDGWMSHTASDKRRDEHLRHTCKCCGYVWTSDTLDHVIPRMRGDTA